MIEDKEVDLNSYRWERGINATWENVQEDQEGNIIQLSDELSRSHRAKLNRITKSVRRGLIRYIVVVLDCSEAAGEKDYRPNRLEACKSILERFVRDYFDQNPISQLAFGITANEIVEKKSELSGNSKNHITKISELVTVRGLASLKNSLLFAMTTLKHIPNYGHRELLIVYNSLSTCDHGDILETLEEAKKMKLRISIICLAAEIYICRYLTEQTGGQFAVALDAQHLQDLLNQHTIPSPEALQQEPMDAQFIYMGFPKRTFGASNIFGYDGKKVDKFTDAYICPRCLTRASDIPTQCCVCSLQLNSSSHIARSFHHLFPIPNFIEYMINPVPNIASTTSNPLTLNLSTPRYVAQLYQPENGIVLFDAKDSPITMPITKQLSHCYGCLMSLESVNKAALLCPQCKNLFCIDCDLFIHDSLHNCPGCG